MNHSNDVLATNSSEAGQRATVFYRNATAQFPYEVQVAGRDGSTGPYTVRVSYDDFPDRRDNAHRLAFEGDSSDTFFGFLEEEGDVDWFRCSLPAETILEIRIDNPDSGLDTHGVLYNAAGLVAQDHAQIRDIAQEGQTYWLKVRAGSENGAFDVHPDRDPAGRYRLRIKHKLK